MTNNLKIEQLKSLFNCQLCSEVLVQPITLPCGVSICEFHLETVVNRTNCSFCNHDHSNNKYHVNEKLSRMLELQVNEIELGSKFENCKSAIERAKSFANKIRLITEAPGDFIYEYFREVRRKVDIQREELKLKIDDYSKVLMDQIDEIQERKGCIIEITKEPDTNVTCLEGLIERFDSFEFSDEKYEDIIWQVNQLSRKLEDLHDDYKYSILGGRDYELGIGNMSMNKVFGLVVSKPRGKSALKKSKILSSEQVFELVSLCRFHADQNFRLLYRASEDSFNSASFHQKCDGIKNTLTIIKTTHDYIFGGFTGAAWNSAGNYIYDTNSFIFSLVNNLNSPFKAKCMNNHDSIYGSSVYLATFGAGHDLCINSDSNLDQNSYSNFGKSYGRPGIFLAGFDHFQTTEIEVFEKLD